MERNTAKDNKGATKIKKEVMSRPFILIVHY